jgi:uncharacterized membrane protein YciS (DUF1049 family)
MEIEIYELIAVVVSFIVGLIVSKQYYSKFKAKLSQVRRCLDRLDDALADNKISKEEAKEIFESCKQIFER